MDQNDNTATDVMTDNGISLQQRGRKCNLVVRAIILLVTKNHLNIILAIKNQAIALKIVRFLNF